MLTMPAEEADHKLLEADVCFKDRVELVPNRCNFTQICNRADSIHMFPTNGEIQNAVFINDTE